MIPVEALATVFNACANARLLAHAYRAPEARVPASVVVLQVLANTAWVTHATLHHDPYLGGTALMSLAMQATSLCLLLRASSGVKPTDRAVLRAPYQGCAS